MAIDTKTKRQSAAGAMKLGGFGYPVGLPSSPDSDVDEGDRAQIAGVYRDFDFDEPGPSTSREGKWYISGIISPTGD